MKWPRITEGGFLRPEALLVLACLLAFMAICATIRGDILRTRCHEKGGSFVDSECLPLKTIDLNAK